MPIAAPEVNLCTLATGAQVSLSDELCRVAVAFRLTAAAVAELGLAGLDFGFAFGYGGGGGQNDRSDRPDRDKLAELRKCCEAEVTDILNSTLATPPSRNGVLRESATDVATGRHKGARGVARI